MKKGWQKPKLVVLTRGRVEESVLDACKAPGFPDVSATTNDTGCIQNCVWCDPCSEVGTS